MYSKLSFITTDQSLVDHGKLESEPWPLDSGIHFYVLSRKVGQYPHTLIFTEKRIVGLGVSCNLTSFLVWGRWHHHHWVSGEHKLENLLVPLFYTVHESTPIVIKSKSPRMNQCLIKRWNRDSWSHLTKSDPDLNFLLHDDLYGLHLLSVVQVWICACLKGAMWICVCVRSVYLSLCISVCLYPWHRTLLCFYWTAQTVYHGGKKRILHKNLNKVS